MKIQIGCSKHFYENIPPIKDYLESKGHVISLPNSYDEQLKEERLKSLSFGGATFLEIYTAWKLSKRIFLYNPIPENIFTDELTGINPKVINRNLEEII
ncbi:MAG TPA: hypothetical protein VJH65_00660 [Candidatus Nanoarchaeia archaeon]|nr:hypothetical protein [Candidatus Nanoarchaeia archaeon]